jgi:hypothetical protein
MRTSQLLYSLIECLMRETVQICVKEGSLSKDNEKDIVLILISGAGYRFVMIWEDKAH